MSWATQRLLTTQRAPAITKAADSPPYSSGARFVIVTPDSHADKVTKPICLRSLARATSAAVIIPSARTRPDVHGVSRLKFAWHAKWKHWGPRDAVRRTAFTVACSPSNVSWCEGGNC